MTNFNKDRKARRKTSLDLDSMIYGKVPPRAPEIEDVILGVLMLDATAYDKISSIIKAEHFYKDANQRIFNAIVSLLQKSKPTEFLMVVEELRVKGELDMIGGPYYVSKLTDNVVSSASIIDHAKIVYQKALSRKILTICGEAIGQAYEDSVDPFDLLNDVQAKFSELSVHKKIKSFKTIQEISIPTLNNIQEIKLSGNPLTGVPSGVKSIDDVTQGWQPSNLIIMAARPGVGKSALAANFALNAATHPEKPTPTAVFSLEMPETQWALRILSAKSELLMYDLKRGQITDSDVRELEKIVYSDFEGVQLYFDDTSSMDIYEFKSRVRLLVLKYGVRLVVLDYIQLMSGSKTGNETREQEISRISRELKLLAKELNIPIIALCQLNRLGDTEEPKLSHLRESGALEQNADDVFFIVPVSEEDVNNNADLRDCVMLKIGKHRNGIGPDIPVRFVKQIQKLMGNNEYYNYIGNKQTPGWTQIQNPDRNIETGKKDDTPF